MPILHLTTMHIVQRLSVPVLGICLALSSLTPRPVAAHEAGAQMSAIAKVFLAALTPEQKAKASFDFATEEAKSVFKTRFNRS